MPKSINDLEILSIIAAGHGKNRCLVVTLEDTSDGSLVTLPAVPVTPDAYSVSTLSAYHGTSAILEALGFRLEGHVLLGDDDEGITPVDTATCWELAPYATTGVKD